MTILETLTKKEQLSLLTESSIVGMFPTMIVVGDPFYDLAYPMCLNYYTSRSASKRVSPMFKLYKETMADAGLSSANLLIGGSVIRPKFIDKWTRVYNALITEQYSPLDDYKETEIKIGNDTDTTTFDITEGKTGNNTDVLTHDVTTESNGKTATNETTTRSSDVYGFNSSSPVGDTADTETVTGNADDNTTENIQTRKGTESKALGINETNKKTGTQTKEFGLNETHTRSGRHTNGADLVKRELDLRNQEIFFDIVFKDIDSIATISIY